MPPQRLERPAVVVVDNAPIHTSDDFAEQKLLWQAQDLAVKFIPPYCPEFNLIELLWRKIKYEGLPLNASKRLSGNSSWRKLRIPG